MPLIDKAGRHDVTVKTASLGESGTGTPFLQLDFERDDGAVISGWVYLTDAALEGAMRTLRDAFKFDGNFETVEAQVTGKDCAIVTQFESYQGKERLKVKFINSRRAPVKPLEGGASFLKTLTQKGARIPVDAPRTKAATKAPAAATDSEFPT